MPASPAGGNDPCNCGAVLQKCKDGLQPAAEGVAPEDRSPFALEEGELAHGDGWRIGAHEQMRAQVSDVNTKDLHEAAEIIDGIDHVWVLLDDVGEKLRVDERDWELLV